MSLCIFNTMKTSSFLPYGDWYGKCIAHWTTIGATFWKHSADCYRKQQSIAVAKHTAYDGFCLTLINAKEPNV